jgi:hypothetical protein
MASNGEGLVVTNSPDHVQVCHQPWKLSVWQGSHAEDLGSIPAVLSYKKVRESKQRIKYIQSYPWSVSWVIRWVTKSSQSRFQKLKNSARLFYKFRMDLVPSLGVRFSVLSLKLCRKFFPSVARPLWRYFPDLKKYFLMYCFQSFLISGFK